MLWFSIDIGSGLLVSSECVRFSWVCSLVWVCIRLLMLVVLFIYLSLLGWWCSGIRLILKLWVWLFGVI